MKAKRTWPLTVQFGVLLIMLGGVGYWLISGDWHYGSTALAICGGSLVIMSFLKGRFVFIYTVSASLAFGFFLTGAAFLRGSAQYTQVGYMYVHLLVTAFLLIYWVLQASLQTLLRENRDLRDHVSVLEQHVPNIGALTLTAFISQGKKALAGAMRRDEEVWLLTFTPTGKNRRLRKLVQEKIANMALQAVRDEYDFVSMPDDKVMVLLQGTTEGGAVTAAMRILSGARDNFNEIDLPFTLTKKKLTNDVEFEEWKGGRSA